MNLPFCDQCRVNKSCIQDLALFKKISGNKRIPPEEYCAKQHAANNVYMGDWYKNILVRSLENPTSLYPVFPELKKDIETLIEESKAAGNNTEYLFRKLPMSVTLMLTERCNLACKYCYERFSGNLQPKTMSRETVDKTLDRYLTPETLKLNESIIWDLIGGEIMVEFDLLKYTTESIIERYKQYGVCPRNITLSFCTNGTLFTPEKREWLEKIKKTIGLLNLGLSLDGIKECHDLCRNNSFDRVMEHFDWWKKTFPESGIKGTISPDNLKYLSRNVLFYVEELKLPQFYINPTFEGPWTDEHVALYGDELTKCAEYFLDHQEYKVLDNSNLFMNVGVRRTTKENWCGCGTHMRGVSPDGDIYPCLRAVTSDLCKLGNLDTGEDRNKLVPFYLYTRYNDDHECQACEIVQYCPSCAMQWVEDTGDLFFRSKKLCQMTKVRYQVSKWYFDHMTKEAPQGNSMG